MNFRLNYRLNVKDYDYYFFNHYEKSKTKNYFSLSLNLPYDLHENTQKQTKKKPFWFIFFLFVDSFTHTRTQKSFPLLVPFLGCDLSFPCRCRFFFGSAAGGSYFCFFTFRFRFRRFCCLIGSCLFSQVVVVWFRRSLKLRRVKRERGKNCINLNLSVMFISLWLKLKEINNRQPSIRLEPVRERPDIFHSGKVDILRDARPPDCQSWNGRAECTGLKSVVTLMRCFE